MPNFIATSFLHPEFFALAAALVSVPIIIHLINRLRFKRLRWAAMEFLLKAQKKNRRKLILEQLLLLALRCLLVALVGLLVMRYTKISFANVGEEQSVHIVLLDDSLSMNDRWKTNEGYTNCFELAKKDILSDKIAVKLSESKTRELLVVLPLSTAASESVFSKPGELTAEDRADSKFGGSGGRMKLMPVQLEPGNFTIRLGSPKFNGYVRVLGPGEDVLAESDNSGGSQVRLPFTAEAAGKYTIAAASVDRKTGDFQLEVFKETASKRYNLVDANDMKRFKEDVAQLKPTKLHLNLLDGVKQIRKIADEYPKALITVHVLSDFRKKDWGVDESAALHKELVDLARQRKAQVHLVDTVVDPAPRVLAAGAPPAPAHDNVGIVDLKPRSRMVGKNMPVTFTMTLVNYGPDEKEVKVAIYEHKEGEPPLRHDEVDFNPPFLKLKPREITQATFEIRFSPKNLGPNQSHFAAISAHLESIGPDKTGLDKDGLEFDNVAYGMVEVRDQVPVLVIDGEGEAGYKDPNKGRDSYFLSQAFDSVPGASSGAAAAGAAAAGDDDDGAARTIRPYRVDFPWEEVKDGKGKVIRKKEVDSRVFLETGDLKQYPTIILANVPQLSEDQLKKLEKYVDDGGGLAIFMGPLVSPKFYNDQLYKDGKGLLPVPLKEAYYPAAKQDGLKWLQAPALLLRDDNPKLKPFPIFGAILTAPEQRQILESVAVSRYFPAKSRPDENDPRRVFELATLPNDKPLKGEYSREVMDIICKDGDRDTDNKLMAAKLDKLLAQDGYKQYAKAFEPYRISLRELVENSGKRPFVLAQELEKMLNDRGTGAKDSPNLEKFWSQSDQQVKDLKTEVVKLIDKVRYGDPFIFINNYGKGKVVTVMTTAGKLWNEWGGNGSVGSALFQPFIWEMQNYLSAQGSNVNLTLGKRLDVSVEAGRLDTARIVKLKMYRSRLLVDVESDEAKSAKAGKKGRSPAEVKAKGPPKTRDTDKGQQVQVDNVMNFGYPSTLEPGVYVTELFYDDDKEDGKKKAEGLQAEMDRLHRKLEEVRHPAKGPVDKGEETKLKKELDEATEAFEKIKPIKADASVFNVDTLAEGNLERVGYDVIKVNILDKSEKRANFSGADIQDKDLVPAAKDLSEAPWLFLLFLVLLVAEQALAVHLSFHLKGNEAFVPAGQAQRPAAA